MPYKFGNLLRFTLFFIFLNLSTSLLAQYAGTYLVGGAGAHFYNLESLLKNQIIVRLKTF